MLNSYLDESIKRDERQKKKPFLSTNEAWCSLHSVMVVAEQLVG